MSVPAVDPMDAEMLDILEENDSQARPIAPYVPSNAAGMSYDSAPRKRKQPRQNQAMDMDAAEDAYPYTVTLTCQDGFDAPHVEAIIHWHKTDPYFVQCLLSSELHMSGELHFHGLIDVYCKQTAGVTRRYERFYKNKSIPFQKGISIKVKRQTDRHGAVHYLSKEMDPEDDYLVCRGWKETWLAAIKKDLKHITHKQTEKDYFVLTKKNAVPRAMQFARAHNIRLVSQQCFVDLCVAMGRDKYLFDNVNSKWMYCTVMLLNGHEGPFRSMWENDLHFLS